MKSKSVKLQVKATEQYFPVVLFIVLHKLVLTSDSVCKYLCAGQFKY